MATPSNAHTYTAILMSQQKNISSFLEEDKKTKEDTEKPKAPTQDSKNKNRLNDALRANLKRRKKVKKP